MKSPPLVDGQGIKQRNRVTNLIVKISDSEFFLSKRIALPKIEVRLKKRSSSNGSILGSMGFGGVPRPDTTMA